MLAIFGWEDQYGVFQTSFSENNWDNDKRLHGIPICHGYEYVMQSTGEGTKTEDMMDYLLQAISNSYKP